MAAHLAAEVPSATVIGVDIDPHRGGVRSAEQCAHGRGWTSSAPIHRDAPRFDLITAVAPYVPTAAIALLPADVQRHEPRLALDGGIDGTELVGRIVSAAARLLHPGGHLLVEIGGEQQDALVDPLTAAGFGEAAPWVDEDGDLRGLVAMWRSPNLTP